MARVFWFFRQFIPHTLWTVYGDEAGHNHFVIWKMFAGRCYDVTDIDFETAG